MSKLSIVRNRSQFLEILKECYFLKNKGKTFAFLLNKTHHQNLSRMGNKITAKLNSKSRKFQMKARTPNLFKENQLIDQNFNDNKVSISKKA